MLIEMGFYQSTIYTKSDVSCEVTIDKRKYHINSATIVIKSKFIDLIDDKHILNNVTLDSVKMIFRHHIFLLHENIKYNIDLHCTSADYQQFIERISPILSERIKRE